MNAPAGTPAPSWDPTQAKIKSLHIRYLLLLAVSIVVLLSVQHGEEGKVAAAQFRATSQLNVNILAKANCDAAMTAGIDALEAYQESYQNALNTGIAALNNFAALQQALGQLRDANAVLNQKESDYVQQASQCNKTFVTP